LGMDNFTETDRTDPRELCEALREGMTQFFRLNREVCEPQLRKLYAIADELGASVFHGFAELASRLVRHYAQAPWKVAEARLMREYFDRVEQATRLLSEAGKIDGMPPPADEQQSMALVSPRLFSALGWCKVMSDASIPGDMMRGVDAIRRRNELVESVLEPMFVILHRIDHGMACAWEADFLEENRGKVDADVARDMMRAWRQIDDIPVGLLEWPLSWAIDENLLRQWPAVVREADLLLRRQVLRIWHDRGASRTSSIALLRKLVAEQCRDGERYRRWLNMAIIEMGQSIDFFVQLTRQVESGEELAGWEREAMMREIRVIEAVFTSILLMADVSLSVPDGGFRLAMALFGLTGPGRAAWQRRLEAYCEKLLLRIFLRALRTRTSAEEIIHKLCFRDAQLFLETVGELDLVTREFDSVRQRDKVVKRLAVYYASFREPQLLAQEISRRYRQLMRIVHEDSLRRVLTPAQFEEADKSNVLRELASIAADARRFLSKRRALDTSIAEMAAAEMDFARGVRKRRQFYVRKYLSM